MALLLSLLCFIIAVFFFKLRANKSKLNLNLPPSPPKLPFIGNLHQLGTLPHHSFHSLSQKYGPIMYLQLGQSPTVVISSPELASHILRTHDIAFADRPQGTCPKTLLYIVNSIVYGLYGENWRQNKKITGNELLSLKRVQSFKNIREEEVGELVRKIRDLSLSEACTSVNLRELLITTANDIVCTCVLGRKFNTEGDTRIGELASGVMVKLTAFSVADYFPSLGWVDILTGLVRKLKAHFQEFDGFFDHIIEDRKFRAKEGNDDHFSNEESLLDILLKLREDRMQDDEFTRDDLKSILLEMIVGGTNTTAVTVEWAMVELMRNPMKMKKVQEDVRRAVRDKSKVDESDINQMSYLKCVIKETLRLHPPAPLLVPRVASSSVEINGYTIPTKTTVYINLWAIQRNTEIWERSNEFYPERFEVNSIDFKGQDFLYFPFGSGRRRCPGMTFGIAAVEYMLSCLLFWFDWKLPRNNDGSVQDIDMSETFGLAVSRKVPLYLQPIPYSFES